MSDRRSELVLATVIAALSALTLFVWIPADIDTGMIETFRRQTFIGDAFLPALSAAGMMLCALIQLVTVWRRAASDRPGPVLDGTTLAFFVGFAVIVAVSLATMFWLGAAVWDVLGDGERTYREMRGTAPWKYLGFAFGGTALVWGTISLIEGRVSAKRLLAAALFVTALIAIFDLPFDSILLPPNGDW
ncbi:hypothetical protein RM543_12760 [Roseicyclus sp. F158]|uniref:Tripartite tricarboxylate transporter TctB family protein n=1 Tax=Tropicimonas omnivorans TaxID=3075590 RepID=A0ABU3DIL5_9RHOB|nr:hypothetical protein [Roseicyclus sp. F158]MDT0683561.1 hypothetical protein [Roseicyclus sp. F158]